MQELSSLEQLDELKQSADALLVLYGGKECNVCHSIKPKLIELMQQNYPKVTMVYIDCHMQTDICSQNSIFTLPTLQVFFAGQKFTEEVRSFSLQKVIQDMQKPYSMLFAQE